MTDELRLEDDNAFIIENAERSQTEMYDLVRDRKICIVRRGNLMKIGLRFQREVKPKSDLIQFSMRFDDMVEKPSLTSGTKANFRLRNDKIDQQKTTNWNARIHRLEKNWLIVYIKIPAFAPVGKWNLRIFTNRSTRSEFPTPIFILFNPFDEDDPVYCGPSLSKGSDDAIDTDDYIFRTCGNMYMDQTLKFPWHYSQFDEVILPVAWHLLGPVAQILQVGNGSRERGDPVKVVRLISSVIPSKPEAGKNVCLLEGKWGMNDYSDGTSPEVWTGSLPIFTEYKANRFHTVKYAQCWVFAGAVVTLCRAIGIPCRAITTLNAGGDGPKCDLRITKLYDDAGKCSGNSDMTWIYHTWNEAWMERRDLPDGYGGWQSFDATPPQLPNYGLVHRCGPASVKAVRAAQVGFVYDVPFIFSAVNADVYTYRWDPETGRKELLAIETDTVGSMVLTEAPGKKTWLDITSSYKPKEGTAEERRQYMTAVRRMNGAVVEIANDDSENRDELQEIVGTVVPVKKVPFGSGFVAVMKIKNQASGDRTVTVHIKVSGGSYRNTNNTFLLFGRGTLNLKPGVEGPVSLPVSPDLYIGKILPSFYGTVEFFWKIKETGRGYILRDVFPFIPPRFDIQMEPPKVLSTTRVWLKFKNPLSIPLTGCFYMIQAPGMITGNRERFRNVGAGEEVTIEMKVKTMCPGRITVIATFHSNELDLLRDAKEVFAEE